MVEQISTINFEEKTKQGFVVVDFWAEWCGPCKSLGPIFDELSKEMDNKLKFFKLNVDENQETAGKFGVMSIPTMLVLKDGKEIDRIVGALPKDKLQEKLEAAIS